MSSTVIVDRSQSSQRGNFFSTELSNLGRIGQHGSGGRGTDAFNAGEQLGVLAPVIVLVDQRLDVCLDGFDLLFKHFQDSANAVGRQLGDDLLQAAVLGRAKVDELATSIDELLEVALRQIGLGQSAWLIDLSKLGDDACINGISLGQAHAFRESANPARIDMRDGEIVLKSFGNEQTLVPAGAFDDQTTGLFLLSHLLQKFGDAGPIIIDGEGLARGSQGDIQLGFGDINTDIDQIVHGIVPPLRIRARGLCRRFSAQAAVRAKTKRPTTIKLEFGLS